MLPEGFQFSQASLQDFVECHKRFQLRYVLGLQWPAAESEPIEQNERRVQLGQAFHQLVQQQMAGLPEERITRAAQDPDLAHWWQSILLYRPVAGYGGDSPTAVVRSESALLGSVGGQSLIAKYDVLIVEPGVRAVILDWKTSQKKRPADQDLRNRLQSRVYPFLLVQAGAHLNHGRPIAPERVEMVYWFPEYPDSPTRFTYTAEQAREDEGYLARLVQRIANAEDDDFVLTDDVRRCGYCPYRSYCGRGDRAAQLDALVAGWEPGEGLEGFELDFEHIAEVEF